MQCNEVEKWIESLVDDEITWRLKKDVETHVGDCRSCERILQNTRTLKNVLRNSLPLISPPGRLDANVMKAFYSAREKRAATKTPTWRSAFFQRVDIPKPIAALLTVLIAALLGLAFQLGRVSVSAAQKVSDTPAPLAQIIGIPVTKVVEVPVIKEKLVTHYVYVNKQRNDDNQIKSIRGNPQTDNLELNSSIAENGYITQTNLKGFQPTAEIKIGVRKGGKDNER